jgi:AcrR family transcriptional regulator
MTVPGARKNAILTKAARLFLDRGFDGTSIDMIVKEAEISRPGLYYHFKGKQDLLYQIMRYGLDELERNARGILSSEGDAAARLRTMLYHSALSVTRADDEAISFLVIGEIDRLSARQRADINRRRRAHLERIKGLLEELHGKGKLREIDAGVAALGLLWMVFGVGKWYRPDGRLTAEEIASEVAHLALASVLQPGVSL